MNNSNNVQVRISRKDSLVSYFDSYDIYINGLFIRTIKGGQNIKVDVPKCSYYIIGVEPFLNDGSHAIMPLNNNDEISIKIATEGGWKTPGRAKFYLVKEDKTKELLNYDPFRRLLNKFSEMKKEGILISNNSEISSEEKIALLCLQFWESFSLNFYEILHSTEIEAMLSALEIVGAKSYLNTYYQIIDSIFPNVSLPLDKDKDYTDKIDKAEEMLVNLDTGFAFTKELYGGLIKYMGDNYMLENMGAI